MSNHTKTNAVPIVEVKPHSYQPSKAEREEVIGLKNPDGQNPTPEELATWLLRPVKIIESE